MGIPITATLLLAGWAAGCSSSRARARVSVDDAVDRGGAAAPTRSEARAVAGMAFELSLLMTRSGGSARRAGLKGRGANGSSSLLTSGTPSPRASWRDVTQALSRSVPTTLSSPGHWCARKGARRRSTEDPRDLPSSRRAGGQPLVDVSSEVTTQTACHANQPISASCSAFVSARTWSRLTIKVSCSAEA